MTKLKAIHYGKDAKGTQKIFKKILKTIYPKLKHPDVAINENQGYIYCDDSVLNGGPRKIHAPNTKFHGKEFEKVHKTLVKLWKQDDKDAESIIYSEYKVHLMPKPEYILPAIALILIKCRVDESFRKLINCFKIAIKPNTTSDGKAISDQKPVDKTTNTKNMANIVIYPHLGRATTEKLLAAVIELFSDFDLEEIAQSSVTHTPRYNRVVNDLIYYSQGGGDAKDELMEADDRDLLSEEMTHFIGGVHIDTEPMIELTKEKNKDNEKEKEVQKHKDKNKDNDTDEHNDNEKDKKNQTEKDQQKEKDDQVQIEKLEEMKKVSKILKTGLKEVDDKEAVVSVKDSFGGEPFNHIRIQFEYNAQNKLEDLKAAFKKLNITAEQGTNSKKKPIVYLPYKEVSKMSKMDNLKESFIKKYKN